GEEVAKGDVVARQDELAELQVEEEVGLAEREERAVGGPGEHGDGEQRRRGSGEAMSGGGARPETIPSRCGATPPRRSSGPRRRRGRRRWRRRAAARTGRRRGGAGRRRCRWCRRAR